MGEESKANTASVALQRHRTVVVDCLKDPDISIRQRALELVYHLVNVDNVTALTAELLNYLVLCPREHRADICDRVLRVVDEYAPSDRWQADTLLTLLTIAGRECGTGVQSAAAAYAARGNEELRAYATHRLLKAMQDDRGSRGGLPNVGLWCVGEYGNLLLKSYHHNPPPVANGDDPAGQAVSFAALDPAEVVVIVEEVTGHHAASPEVRARALTCYAKLRERFANAGDAGTLDWLGDLVRRHESSRDLDLQLRSCEYGALLNAAQGVARKRANKEDAEEEDIFGGSCESSVSATIVGAAKEALAQMPAVDVKLMQRKREQRSGALASGGMLLEKDFGGKTDRAVCAPIPASGDGEPGLLDLDDIFGVRATSALAAHGSALVAAAAVQSDVDLLSDVFSAPPVAPTLNAVVGGGGFDMFPQPSPAPPVAANDLFAPMPVAATPLAAPGGAIDPFTAQSPTLHQPSLQQLQMAVAPVAAAPATADVTVPGFSHQGLSVTFHCTKPDAWNKQHSVLMAKFQNTTDAPLYGLHLQVAVPKYVTMEMQPPTSTTVPVPGGSSTKEVMQTVKVTNTLLGTKSLMLKLKASFTSKGAKVDHMVTCTGFPAGQF